MSARPKSSNPSPSANPSFLSTPLSPQLLFQHFESLIDTPGAIAKLRVFILDLAASGMLLGGTRCSNRQKQKLRDVIELISGQHLTPEEYNDQGDGIPYLTGPADFGARYPTASRWTTVPKATASKGDILLTVKGAGVGKTNVVQDSAVAISRQLMAVRPKTIDRSFLELSLRAAFAVFQAASNGIAIPGISRGDVLGHEIWVPDLAEQHRIVAKVKELLALCDELEATQVAAREHLTRLVHSALDHLTAAKDDQDFRKQCSFILHNSSLILESVPALRQAILSLAVQGRLTARGRPDNVVPLVKFEEIILNSRYGTSKKCHHQPDGTVVLRIPNVVGGEIDLSDVKRTQLTDAEKAELSLKQGDLLLVRSNGSESLVGRAAVVPDGCDGHAFAGYLVRIRLITAKADPEFARLALSSQLVRDQIEKPIRTTSGVKNINTQEIYRLSFPLPSIADQQRIVAKVHELMRWSDELETRLTAAQTSGTRLLDAVIHEALAL